MRADPTSRGCAERVRRKLPRHFAEKGSTLWGLGLHRKQVSGAQEVAAEMLTGRTSRKRAERTGDLKEFKVAAASGTGVRMVSLRDTVAPTCASPSLHDARAVARLLQPHQYRKSAEVPQSSQVDFAPRLDDAEA